MPIPMELWGLTSLKNYRMSLQAEDSKESQWCSSSPKASRLETQKELMFQFECSQVGGILSY